MYTTTRLISFAASLVVSVSLVTQLAHYAKPAAAPLQLASASASASAPR